MNKVKIVGLALVLLIQACSSIKTNPSDCGRPFKNVAICEQSAQPGFSDRWVENTKQEAEKRSIKNNTNHETPTSDDVTNGFFHTLIEAISSIFKD